LTHNPITMTPSSGCTPGGSTTSAPLSWLSTSRRSLNAWPSAAAQ
jgi:hypothetical protein